MTSDQPTSDSPVAPAGAMPADRLPDALAEAALTGRSVSTGDALRVLVDPEVDLHDLLHAAYRVRRHHWGRSVQIHILNNAQNGKCPEDCSYCTQARTSEVDIEEYPLKSDEEVLEEARLAHEAGAFRYCMVFSGRGPSNHRTAELARLIRLVKDNYPLEVCVSAGLLDGEKAAVLADAGLDRLNHNLNTARERYSDICSTHTYQDRIDTIRAAAGAGIGTCSGLIAGMGEAPEELVEIAAELAGIEADSIPVNFLLPFEGNVLQEPVGLTPEYCLRVLCMFRFTNPSAEVRCSAGREFHLKSLEPMSLLPANSLFLEGYLNATGAPARRTLQMISDSGFEIVADRRLDDLLADEDTALGIQPEGVPVQLDTGTQRLKTGAELRPGTGEMASEVPVGG